MRRGALQKIPAAPKRNFVASVEGNLDIKKAGVYTFCASSSDRCAAAAASRLPGRVIERQPTGARGACEG